MYQIRPEFTALNDDDIVWRYRTVEHFTSILENSSLYFSSIKKLQEMDKLEGTFPQSHNTGYLDAVEKAIKEQPEDEEAIRIVAKLSSQAWDNIRETVSLPWLVANCWNINEIEDENMWHGYAKTGLAIKTTFQKLTKSFEASYMKLIYGDGSEVPIHAGKIHYLDRDKQYIPNNPAGWHLVLQKERSKFAHEKELRIATSFHPLFYGLSTDISRWHYYPSDTVGKFPKQLIVQGGIFIPINPNILIDTIVISPFAEPELKLEIEQMLEKYAIFANVELSALSL